MMAGVAQLAELLVSNQMVAGSSPAACFTACANVGELGLTVNQVHLLSRFESYHAENWGPMFQGGENALQAICGGFDSHGLQSPNAR